MSARGLGGLDPRVLLGLVDRAVEGALARPDGVTQAAVTRRQLLGALARTTGSALAAAYGASLLAACGSQGPDAARGIVRSQARRNETVERWLFRHTAMDHGRGALAGAAFPNYHVAPAVPVWDAAADGPWALEVAGLVDRPQRLTLDALQRLPRVSQRVNHYCVEGWEATAVWQGVRLRDLARLAGARPEARYVDFRSFDVEKPGEGVEDVKRDPSAQPSASPARQAKVMADTTRGVSRRLTDLRAGRDYHESWDIESATHPQTLIAYGKDGHLLSPAYGAPARLHSPVKLGYKNTKYLTRIVFMAERNGGYWTDAGYEWYGGT